MKKLMISILLLLTLSLCACGNSEEFDNLSSEHEELEEAFAELQQENNTSAEANAELQKNYDSLTEEYESLNSNYESLSEDLDSLQKKYDKLSDKYKQLEEDYEELQLAYEEETKVVVDTPEDLSDYSTSITYQNLARTPDDYIGKAVCFKGKVVQLIEGEDEVQIRLAINGDYDSIIYCAYEPNIIDVRILEDDNVTIYGLSGGIITYESTLGGMISIPFVLVNHIVLND